MIGYIEGALLKKGDERILLLANQVGYEIMVPAIVMAKLSDKQIGDQIALYIYYHQTERQPKPILIGFHDEIEKEFFQHFVSVSAIGPLKAVRALSHSISEIATAIENDDVVILSRLKGIGRRTAQKIVAALHGKMDRFIEIHGHMAAQADPQTEISEHVLDVLVSQLGHKTQEAQQLIRAALKRNPGIATSEQLFEEVYRVHQR